MSDRAKVRIQEAMSSFPYPHVAIPAPRLESDFRVKVALCEQPAAAAVAAAKGSFKRRDTYEGGTWSGHFGHGTVVVSTINCFLTYLITYFSTYA